MIFVLNFTYENSTKLIFGKGVEESLCDEIKLLGSRVLLHYGSSSIKKSGLYDKVVDMLNKNNIFFKELSGVKPNPRVSLIREGIKIVRENKLDFVLAVGGGSVIDSSKAIAFGSDYDGDVWDFFDEKATITKCLPIGVILTIPAAGSESSVSCVISNEEGLFKRGVKSNLFRPKFAIMNPEFTYSLPPFQTAAGCCDMMIHVLERYFTNEKNVEITDRFCESLLKTIIHNSKIILDDPRDYNGRAEIMMAGSIAHNGFLGLGRSEDWASHKIEHELSAIYDITHGAGLSIVIPAWMKYVYSHNVNRFVQYANRVWNIDINFNNLEETALLGIEKTEEFFKSLGLPTRLNEVSIDDSKFAEMAEKACVFGPIGGFIKLKPEDIIKILKICL